MRVIAGSAKSLPLKTVEGMDTRPTTDRIKETLFNMLAPHLYECRFLDLFSGSGGIGIEALSRGASYCVFVEHSRKACACISHNLEFTHLADKARLVRADVQKAFVSDLADEPAFDWIFMDPPYGRDLEKQALLALKQTNLMHPDTRLILEAKKGTDFSYLDGSGYEVVCCKPYKTNLHLFLKSKESKKEA